MVSEVMANDEVGAGTGPWLLRGPATPACTGWKLHVSASVESFDELSRRVTPILENSAWSYKIARDLDAVRRLNTGDYGAQQIGKIVTIYPLSVDNGVVASLIDATQQLNGPAVFTDWHLGGTVYARFGIFDGQPVKDRFGFSTRTFVLEDGTEYLDDYSAPLLAPEIWPFARSPSNDHVQPDPRLGHLILLQVLSRTGTGNVVLGLDACERRFVVVRQERHYAMAAPGQDSGIGREWRALSVLADRRIAPQPYQLIEARHSSYLLSEYVPGQSVSAAFKGRTSRAQVASVIQQILEATVETHRAGVVHGDISAANVILCDDRCVLVDFALSAAVGEPSIGGYTLGYQRSGRTVGSVLSPDDDYYALVMLYCALRTGNDPSRLLSLGSRSGVGLAHVLERTFELDEHEARVCQEAVEGRAPYECLVELSQRRTKPFPVAPLQSEPRSMPPESSRVDAHSWLEIAAEMFDRLPAWEGVWLSVSPEATSSPAWLPTSLVPMISAHQGVSGVLYALADLAELGMDSSILKPRVEHCVDWLLDEPSTTDADMPGLHFGRAGVATCVARVCRSGLIPIGPWLENYARDALKAEPDWLDITHGAAGQLIAALELRDLVGDGWFTDRAAAFSRFLLAAQTRDGSFHTPAGVRGIKEGTVYTGFAHGVAGIAYALARAGHALSQTQYLEAALAAGKWLLRCSKLEGRRRLWQVEPGKAEYWHWWCHGGPGVAKCFLQLYEVTGARQWRESADEALETWCKPVPSGNAGLCHGLAGIGEILLDAYSVTREARYQLASQKLASRLVDLVRLDPAGGWEGDRLGIATADLMVGSGGILRFLVRSGTPEATCLRFPLS